MCCNGPRIEYDQDRNKYRLVCECGSKETELREVSGLGYSVFCKDEYNIHHGQDAVCSIPCIKDLAIRDCNRNPRIYYEMLEDVYRSLEFDKYLKFDYNALIIEKNLCLNPIFKFSFNKINFERTLPGRVSYIYSYNNMNIKVNTDGKVFANKEFIGNIPPVQ